MAKMSSIQAGDKAPAAVLPTSDGRQIALADFEGKNAVVLFFYPKDNTSICTKEACSFRDSYEDFVAAGAVVIGISSDSDADHRSFAEQHRLPFTLVADTNGSLRKTFGVPRTLGILPGRVTYVIDKAGIVRHVFNSQLLGQKHVTEALRIVRELSGQTTGT